MKGVKNRKGLSSVVSSVLLVVVAIVAVAFLWAFVAKLINTGGDDSTVLYSQLLDKLTEDESVETISVECGNGIVERSNDEICDDGNLRNGDGCSIDCRPLSCEELNGFTCQTGEACLDNVLNSADALLCCSSSCVVPSAINCADCSIDPGNCNKDYCESILEGCYLNSQGACNACFLITSCSSYDSQESCQSDNCNKNCQWNGVCEEIPPACGNGVVDFGEQCDIADPLTETKYGDCDNNPETHLGYQECSSDCLSYGACVATLWCGDNACNSGEDCSSCSQDCGACSEPHCGDGDTDIFEGEQCDDGNIRNGDGCSSQCLREYCGDNRCNNYESCSSCSQDCGSCGNPPGSGSCFMGDTMISASNGAKMIKDIREGDLILSYNGASGGIEYNKVAKLFNHFADSYLIINNELKVTANHPMMINGKWKEIGSAKIGDKMKSLHGEESIYSIGEVFDTVEVYNLEVEGNHNYYANGYLAHNKLDPRLLCARYPSHPDCTI